MAESSFDCVVIGAGPGGYVAAIRAAQLGLRTAVVEKEAPGGVCLNWGCIPTKALLKSAEVLHLLQHASEFGLAASGVGYDFPAVIKRSRVVVDKMTRGVQSLLKKNKIELLMGKASFASKNTIVVKDSSGTETPITYKKAIIAAGARARTAPIFPPVDGKQVLTYRQALEVQEPPKKLLVIGAGAIGIEFSYFFSSFATEVTIVEMLDDILPIEDQEVSKALEKSFSKLGIQIRTKTAVESIEKKGQTVSALLKTAEKIEQWTGDACLIAIGFQGNVEELNLEAVGIRPERSFIQVDQFYRTSAPNIYAIGDIIGAPMLAHVASHEGIVAAEHLAGEETHPIDYTCIPGATYCQPQVASVGFTEKAAREKGYKVKIGKFPFMASGKAVATNETEGFVKVVIDEELEEILGVHIIHPEATELIGEATLARTHEGVASSVFNTVHAHPTLSEAIMEAMGSALGRPIHI